MATFSAQFIEVLPESADYGVPQATYVNTTDQDPFTRVVLQRIYDTGLAQYVYYTQGIVNTAPAPGDTDPSHSGAIVTSTHEVVADRLVDPVLGDAILA